MVWTRLEVEEGLGKRLQNRVRDTVQMADFEPKEMDITSDGKRAKVLEQLPGGVRAQDSARCHQYINSCMQRFDSFDLARDGDKRKVGPDGEPSDQFVDPLRLQYRDVVEVRPQGHSRLSSATASFRSV